MTFLDEEIMLELEYDTDDAIKGVQKVTKSDKKNL